MNIYGRNELSYIFLTNACIGHAIHEEKLRNMCLYAFIHNSQSQPFGKHAFYPPSGPEAFNLFDQHD